MIYQKEIKDGNYKKTCSWCKNRTIQSWCKIHDKRVGFNYWCVKYDELEPIIVDIEVSEVK